MNRKVTNNIYRNKPAKPMTFVIMVYIIILLMMQKMFKFVK